MQAPLAMHLQWTMGETLDNLLHARNNFLHATHLCLVYIKPVAAHFASPLLKYTSQRPTNP
jgi:hypothetical protein